MTTDLRARIRAGDRDAFAQMFDQYARAIYNHGFRLTADWSLADDVVSTTFMEAWRVRERLDPDGGSVRPWLLGIATNIARNLRRGDRRYRAAAMACTQLDQDEPDHAGVTEGRVDDGRRLAAAMAVLATLPRADREVFTLCVWEELDYAAADQARAPQVRTRWSVLLRPAYALPAVALVAAAAFGAVVVTQPDGDTGPAVTTEPAQFAAPQAGSPKGVAELMNRMALVSAGRNRPAPTGSWVYIKSRYTNFSIDKSEEGNKPVSTVADRQSWMSLDGLQGWYVENGSGEDPDGTAVTAPNEPPNVGSPSYRLLSSLPDDPDALLARIRRDTRGQGNGPDSAAFDAVGSMLMESYPPAKLYPALYRAAAKIPGALVVDDAVDAAGRHGIALARVDEIGMRTELIFDRTDYTFLGRRVVATKDLEDGAKAGTVTYSSAVLDRALVDSMKEAPAN